MSDKRITWMHSGQLGAPQMSGAAGSNGQMLQVLDACLIDGFNPQTATTVNKTETTVTLTFGVSHGYALRQLVTVTGANDALLNGKHRVVSLTTNTITINAVGVTVTTGVIVTKIAPLGFDSIFGSADPLKRAYRSKNLSGTRTVLYLDMSLPTSHGYNTTNPAKRAMVDMCEDMTTLGTQINSYTSAFNNRPTNRNGQMFWYQARDANKTTPVTSTENSNWVIVGNGDYFYVFTAWFKQSGQTTSDPIRDVCMFGDVPSFAGATDRHNCAWIGSILKNDVKTDLYFSYLGATLGGDPSSLPVGYFIKSHSGTGGLVPFCLSYGAEYNLSLSGFMYTPITYPNLGNTGYVATNIMALTPAGWRSTMPNLCAILQNVGQDYLAHDLRVDDGILIVATHYNRVSSSLEYGYYAIDMRD